MSGRFATSGNEPPRSVPMAHSMFRCQLCQCVAPARIPSQRLILNRRTRQYPFRSRANVVVRKRKPDRKPKKEYVDDPGGHGEEIGREVTVCPDCAARHALSGNERGYG